MLIYNETSSYLLSVFNSNSFEILDQHSPLLKFHVLSFVVLGLIIPLIQINTTHICIAVQPST